MKKVILSIFGFLSFYFASGQSSSSVYLANHIADKMRDTLLLSNPQRAKVFSINIQLANQKNQARNTILNGDSLRIQIQRIESTRDSLYNTILSSNLYSLYKQKKSVLIRRN